MAKSVTQKAFELATEELNTECNPDFESHSFDFIDLSSKVGGEKIDWNEFCLLLRNLIEIAERAKDPNEVWSVFEVELDRNDLSGNAAQIFEIMFGKVKQISFNNTGIGDDDAKAIAVFIGKNAETRSEGSAWGSREDFDFRNNCMTDSGMTPLFNSCKKLADLWLLQPLRLEGNFGRNIVKGLNCLDFKYQMMLTSGSNSWDDDSVANMVSTLAIRSQKFPDSLFTPLSQFIFAEQGIADNKVMGIIMKDYCLPDLDYKISGDVEYLEAVEQAKSW